MIEDITDTIRRIDQVCDGKNEKLYDLGKRGFLSLEHEYIEVKHNGEIICIDLLIYPLMKLIWDKGIETSACCQGDDKQKGYISFKNKLDLIKFCDKFPYFKNNGEFDVLNIHSKPLIELPYDVIALHTPCYSIRFKFEVLMLFQ